MERTLLEHSFRELPVVTDQGIFRGMVSARAMKSVPRHEWGTARITAIIDPTGRNGLRRPSMATVETALAVGHHDYIPVVDAATDQPIGILSSSDVMRARQHAQDTLRTGVDAAKVTVIRPKTSFEQREDKNL